MSSCHMQVIPSALLIIMYAYHTSMHSYIRIVASHLGTQGAWEARGVEPNPKMVLVDHPKDGRTGHVLGSKDVGKTAQLTDLTRCQILGKPQSIISLPLLLNIVEYMYVIYVLLH
jgi:hypothetical protein